MKDGGKQDIEEIKVVENAEENKAKDYANALESMQNALKREKQIKMEKVIHEKNKANVSFIGNFYHSIGTIKVKYTSNYFRRMARKDSLVSFNHKSNGAILWSRIMTKIYRRAGSGRTSRKSTSKRNERGKTKTEIIKRRIRTKTMKTNFKFLFLL